VSQREYACELADIPDGRGKECVIAARVLAIYKLGNDVVAIDGICPHAGGPLAQGAVCNGIVTCPWHGWQYDLRSGQHRLNPRICVETFRVTVDDGKVYVDV
jgi:nitrite reductase (NADH) small subunit